LTTVYRKLGVSSKLDLHKYFEASARPLDTAGRPRPQHQGKPSIAVLAFENMSGDPDQDYFSDGITLEIITALSRSPWLFVIARNTTFTYKGVNVDVRRSPRSSAFATCSRAACADRQSGSGSPPS
jgi:adenylate cyclase